MLSRAAAALGISWLLAISAAHASSAEQWLVRMANAELNLNYRGTLVRSSGQRIETMRIVHRADQNGVQELIKTLDGTPREVIRLGDRVQSVVPGKSALVVDSPISPRFLRRPPAEAILQNNAVYSVELGGSDRIAGRATRIIEVRPRDEYRYGRRLWLDAQTGMLLRSVMFESGGAVVEKLTFVELELGVRITDDELASKLSSGSIASREVVDPLAGVSVYRRPSWLPEALPQGFRLVTVDAIGDEFEHLLFSDGLASFSIYVEAAEEHPKGEQIEARGSTHVYTGNDGTRMVTVVGEVPAATVSLVGQNLRRVDPSRRRPAR